MSIKTEYRGYTISYSENSDEWSCYDCGVSHVSLSKVKAKIDALHLKLRKAAAVECLSIGGYDSGSSGARPATIIDYLGPRMERSGSFGTERRIADHRVAVFAKALGNDRPSRREADLSSLAFDTPEVQEQVAERDRILTMRFDRTAETFVTNVHSFVAFEPTHWMPLPLPPSR